MNTLSRAITARFFPTPDSYNALRKHWSDLINSERRHELTATHHLLYLTLTGKDWRKAFTPPTNRRKLANGALYGWGMFRAIQRVHWRLKEDELLELFEDQITPDMLNAIRLVLPNPSTYQYPPGDFADGNFPFDAYREEEVPHA